MLMKQVRNESIRVIISDGMALVNKFHKDDSMKTWEGNFQLLQSSGINFCILIVRFPTLTTATTTTLLVNFR